MGIEQSTDSQKSNHGSYYTNNQPKSYAQADKFSQSRGLAKNFQTNPSANKNAAYKNYPYGSFSIL